MTVNPSPDGLPRFYRLGDVIVDRDTRTLLREGEAVRLEPRVFALLDYLSVQGGREVSRAELIAEVWRGAHVVDEAVHRAVSLLRSALGDTAQRPTYLQTTPAKGYRLLQAVDAAPPPKATPRIRGRNWPVVAAAALAGFALGAGVLALWPDRDDGGRIAPRHDREISDLPAPRAATP